MKIGFEDTPAAPAGTYSRHLAELLAEYAPEHEYIVDGARYKEFDLYHGFRPGLPLPLLRKIPSVMTVHNLNFLRYPHLYSLSERLALRQPAHYGQPRCPRRAVGAVADRPRAHRGRDAPRRARPA